MKPTDALAPCPQPQAAAASRGLRPVFVFASFHVACTLAMVVLLACTPEPRGRVAVIFPPWYDAGRVLSAVVAADGRLLRFGSVPWIAVIAPSPGHPVRADRLGALAAINPMIVGGCEIDTPKSPVES